MNDVLDVNAYEWESKVLKSGVLVAVEFWHEHCTWCIRMEPIYDELSKEYRGKVKFAKLNVFESDENKHVALQYGVMSTPTLIFFCGGRPVQTVVGFQPKDRLKQLVDDAIDEHRDCLEKSTPLK